MSQRAVAVLMVAALAGMAWADDAAGPTSRPRVILREDLSSTKLPHGEVVVPAIGSEGAKSGYLFRFSDGKMGSLPAVEKETSVGDLLAQAREKQCGDVFYSPKNGGTLVIISGKSRILGSKLLFEVGNVELERPKALPVLEGHTPGAVEGIKEGEVLLLEKTDGHYAVLRVLRKLDSGVWLEWAAETETVDGGPGPKFAITKGMMVSLPSTGMGNLMSPAAYIPPATLPATAPIGPPTIPLVAASMPARVAPPIDPPTLRPPTATPGVTALAPFFNTYVAQRQAMIEMRLKTMKKEAKTEREMATKADAMDELGQLGAQEAVGPLIEEISFVNMGAKKFSIGTMHPAVQALKTMGKAGSAGALKAIGELNLETGAGGGDAGGGAFLKTPEYKVHLLALVIKGVEGADVAEFLLKREAKKADEGHRKMYELGLAYLQQGEE